MGSLHAVSGFLGHGDASVSGMLLTAAELADSKKNSNVLDMARDGSCQVKVSCVLGAYAAPIWFTERLWLGCLRLVSFTRLAHYALKSTDDVLVRWITMNLND
jgi:hypothetical protein